MCGYYSDTYQEPHKGFQTYYIPEVHNLIGPRAAV